MNHDIGSIFNENVQKLLDTPLISAIAENVLYISLLIIFIIMLIFAFTTNNLGCKYSYKSMIRFCIYVFLTILFGFHLHYKAFERNQRKNQDTSKVNTILNQIQNSQKNNTTGAGEN